MHAYTYMVMSVSSHGCTPTRLYTYMDMVMPVIELGMPICHDMEIDSGEAYKITHGELEKRHDMVAPLLFVSLLLQSLKKRLGEDEDEQAVEPPSFVATQITGCFIYIRDEWVVHTKCMKMPHNNSMLFGRCSRGMYVSIMLYMHVRIM